MLYPIGSHSPSLHPSCKIAPTAVIAGSVSLASNVSVWHHAVLRADKGQIQIGAGSNVQDNCTIHVDAGFPCIVGEGITIGHGTILHGCTIGNHCTIGMGSIILNGAVIGDNCIVGAGALITQNMVIPDGSMVFGSPAKVRRPLTEEEIAHIRHSAAEYIESAREQL